eukprot:3614701-Amphidinium_carterae.2
MLSPGSGVVLNFCGQIEKGSERTVCEEISFALLAFFLLHSTSAPLTMHSSIYVIKGVGVLPAFPRDQSFMHAILWDAHTWLNRGRVQPAQHCLSL